MKVRALVKKLLFLNPSADVQIQMGPRRVNVRRVAWKVKSGKIVKIILKN